MIEDFYKTFMELASLVDFKGHMLVKYDFDGEKIKYMGSTLPEEPAIGLCLLAVIRFAQWLKFIKSYNIEIDSCYGCYAYSVKTYNPDTCQRGITWDYDESLTTGSDHELIAYLCAFQIIINRLNNDQNT